MKFIITTLLMSLSLSPCLNASLDPIEPKGKKTSATLEVIEKLKQEILSTEYIDRKDNRPYRINEDYLIPYFIWNRSLWIPGYIAQNPDYKFYCKLVKNYKNTKRRTKISRN